MSLLDVDAIKTRKEFSVARLEKLKEKLDANTEIPKLDHLCIYVTGSYGRFEASKYSDLDVFFISKGSLNSNPISKVDKAILDANLIRECRDLGLPEFSKGGKYLEIHYIEDVRTHLGGPQDDYNNYFTARMLLLLESIPIYNIPTYNKMLSEIISMYYKDYHDHEKEFRPIFLVNDIQRYWKTLCLNYENNRELKKKRDIVAKNNIHLKNLKLKFSRIVTCYSMVISLICDDGPVTSHRVENIAHMTPLERLKDVANRREDLTPLISDLVGDYAWFLESTSQPNEALLSWIGQKELRNEAFERARRFGDKIHKLVIQAVGTGQKLRYLVV